MTSQRTILLLCALLGGCLSIDVIPQPPPSEHVNAPDGSLSVPPGPDATIPGPDATVPGPDGHVPDPDVDSGNSIPCVDREPRVINGSTYQGRRAACDEGLACVDGACVPLAPCEPGPPHECLYTFEPLHGQVKAYAFYEDHLYWIEGGTYDQRANYQYDGTLVRTKVGDWQREELLGGIDLYSEPYRQEIDVSLTIQGGVAVWSSYTDRDQYEFLVLQGDRPHGVLAADPNTTTWWGFYGNRYAYFGGQRMGYRQTLDGSKPLESFQTPLVARGQLVGDSLIFAYPMVVRIAIEPPFAYEMLSSNTVPEGVSDAGYVGRLPDDWIGTAPVDPESTTLTWTAVAGPGVVSSVDRDFVYWWAQVESGVIVARTRADGSGAQEIIFEQEWWSKVFANTAGVTWEVRYGTLGFLPMPPAPTPQNASPANR